MLPALRNYCFIAGNRICAGNRAQVSIPKGNCVVKKIHFHARRTDGAQIRHATPAGHRPGRHARQPIPGNCVRGTLPIYKVETPDEAGRGDFHTVGGLLIHLAREIPKTGDRFTWQGYQLDVLDMDRTRVDKILVTALAA